MPDEQAKKLGLRAVACEGWAWMPGMLGVHPEKGYPWQGCRMVGRIVYDLNAGNVPPWMEEAPWPDFRDAATKGCLLELVRCAWEDEYACVLPIDYGPGGVMWVCQLTAGGRSLTARHWNTEAEALVAALEDTDAHV